MKPYFPFKEVCLDWQKLILQIQIDTKSAPKLEGKRKQKKNIASRNGGFYY